MERCSVRAGRFSTSETPHLVGPAYESVLDEPALTKLLLPLALLDGAALGLAHPVPFVYCEYADGAQRGLAYERTADGRYALDEESRARLLAWESEFLAQRMAPHVAPAPRFFGAHLEIAAHEVPSERELTHWMSESPHEYFRSDSAQDSLAENADETLLRERRYWHRVAVAESLAEQYGKREPPLLLMPEPVWVQGDQAPRDPSLRFVGQLEASLFSDDVGDFELYVFASGDGARVVTVAQNS